MLKYFEFHDFPILIFNMYICDLYIIILYIYFIWIYSITPCLIQVSA